MIRTYRDLRRLETFQERYEYLRLQGTVGAPTFGFDRWMNQQFYASREWRNLRSHIIVRDNGCDLGADGYEVHDRIYIHHLNPMTVEDIADSDDILDPEFLVATSHKTHNAIHYGDERLLAKPFVERRSGDTKLW